MAAASERRAVSELALATSSSLNEELWKAQTANGRRMTEIDGAYQVETYTIADGSNSKPVMGTADEAIAWLIEQLGAHPSLRGRFIGPRPTVDQMDLLLPFLVDFD
jgi:hypothetical protein